MKNTYFLIPHYWVILMISIFSLYGGEAYAADNKKVNTDGITATDSAKIWFHQSKTDLNPTYHDNEARLQEMIKRLRVMDSTDYALQFSHVKVIGAASPEGNVNFNRYLSQKRALRIFDWFTANTQAPDSIFNFEFIGRDWTGLRELVKKDKSVPSRDEVLITLDEIISSINRAEKDSESNLNRLKDLNNGTPYRYMYQNLFPLLRYSQLYVDYSYRNPQRSLPDMPPTILDITAVPIGVPKIGDLVFETEKPCRPFYMGLKTNLLYDALAIPNIGAEFYVGKNWSVVGNWMYGWWDNDRTHHYWRAYGGDLAVRKWFGKAANDKPLTGHHLGLFAGVVTFDFEFGGKGYMGGLPHRTLWDRCNYMAGVEYGYSLPVAKRLNIDFTIGIGYLGGKMIEYEPKDEIYIWEKTKNYNWVGPTKVEISLVWLIGCDNYKRKYNR